MQQEEFTGVKCCIPAEGTLDRFHNMNATAFYGYYAIKIIPKIS